MNDLKPSGLMDVENYVEDEPWVGRITLPTNGNGIPLYAIPDTYRIVSVELLEDMILHAMPNWRCEEELRAIIDNKEQS